MNNLEKYKKDLYKLIEKGESLLTSIRHDLTSRQDNIVSNTLSQIFRNQYQEWYSEALVVIELILPNRLMDFKKYYEKPNIRKTLNHENYVISDYLQGLSIRGDSTIQHSALNNFEQQFFILKSCQNRFQSSLFEIKQLVQADLFDSELESAKELNKKGFMRGAGAIAGVVLEGHLSQVCLNHKLQTTKEFPPTINGYNELLKNSGVIDLPKWRFIGFLGDLRNLCDHKKSKEPTKDEIYKLIEGANEIIKTVF
jgi:hypothetical protein